MISSTPHSRCFAMYDLSCCFLLEWIRASAALDTFATLNALPMPLLCRSGQAFYGGSLVMTVDPPQ